MLSLLLVTFAPVIIAICGDKLLEKTRHVMTRALVDLLTHGLIGFLSWAVVLYRTELYRNHLSKPIMAEVFVCGTLASFIDVDHFIAARSYRLEVS